MHIDVFKEELEAILAECQDPEECHGKTDELMERALEEMGYDVEPIRKSKRWYS